MAGVATSPEDTLVLSGQGDRATPEALLNSFTAENALEQLSGLPHNLFFPARLKDFFTRWVANVFSNTNPARRDLHYEQPTRPTQATHWSCTTSEPSATLETQQHPRAAKRSRTPHSPPPSTHRFSNRYEGTQTDSAQDFFDQSQPSQAWTRNRQHNTDSSHEWNSEPQQTQQTQSSGWSSSSWQDSWRKDSWWQSADWR